MTPAALYRHFDAEGRLLYVGATVHPTLRQYLHMTNSAWAFDIRRIDIEVFPTKAEALAAERLAQDTESPLHNFPRSGRNLARQISRARADAVRLRSEAERALANAEGIECPDRLFAMKNLHDQTGAA